MMRINSRKPIRLSVTGALLVCMLVALFFPMESTSPVYAAASLKTLPTTPAQPALPSPITKNDFGIGNGNESNLALFENMGSPAQPPYYTVDIMDPMNLPKDLTVPSNRKILYRQEAGSSFIVTDDGPGMLVQGTVVLAGINLTRTSGTGCGIEVASGGTLILMDGTTDGTNWTTPTISGNNNSGIIIDPGGTVIIYSGAVTGNTSATNGGGILNNGGTLEIYGGDISGNTAVNGGGIYSTDSDLYILGSASITNNIAKGGDGGGVWIDDLTRLAVDSGVTFSNNTAQASYTRAATDDELYAANIGASAWSVANPTQGYNNYDIRYFNAPILAPPTTYTVTVNNDGNGAASASAQSAAAGAAITLSATANSGYVFDYWEVVSGGVTLSNINAAAATFTMPAANVTLLAHFKADSAATVIPTGQVIPTPPADPPAPSTGKTVSGGGADSDEPTDSPATSDPSATGWFWIAALVSGAALIMLTRRLRKE